MSFEFSEMKRGWGSILGAKKVWKTKRRVHRCTWNLDGMSRPNRDATERRTKELSSLFGLTTMSGGLSRAFHWFKVRILIYAALRRECNCVLLQCIIFIIPNFGVDTNNKSKQIAGICWWASQISAPLPLNYLRITIYYPRNLPKLSQLR